MIMYIITQSIKFDCKNMGLFKLISNYTAYILWANTEKNSNKDYNIFNCY